MSSESKVTSLSDQELSSRTDVILKYSCRSLPNGLHSADRELLAELKRRFDLRLETGSPNDDDLLAALDEVIIYTQTAGEIEVLGKVRDRLFDLTVGAEAVNEALRVRLDSIISYPGNLSDKDVKTLEEVVAHLTPSTEN